MDLSSRVYQRLTSDTQLAELLTTFDNRPAVFYQRAPAPDNEKWGSEVNFPRIDFGIDTQEDPARNSSGVLGVNVWCDTRYGVEPEDIEARVRTLLHIAFTQADDSAYVFAWARSESFESTDPDNVNTIGVTVSFDIIACPCYYALFPDPIKAMNRWTKKLLPDAVVIGEDKIDGWLLPTRKKPVIYWRLASQSIARKHFTHTWLNITVEGHVYAPTAGDRLYTLELISAEQSLIDHVPMEDTSPLFLNDFVCEPSANFLTTGQMRGTGNFGLLKKWYWNPGYPKLKKTTLTDTDIHATRTQTRKE